METHLDKRWSEGTGRGEREGGRERREGGREGGKDLIADHWRRENCGSGEEQVNELRRRRRRRRTRGRG